MPLHGLILSQAIMLNIGGTIDHISNWLRAYCEASGNTGFVVGISGGVDSAVVSALCGRAGLPVTCVSMPIHQPADHTERARAHIAWMEERFPGAVGIEVDLTTAFDALLKALPATDQDAALLAGANTRARLRMTTLYHLASTRHRLVAGTGNKVEDFGVGFYTKYGDGGVDLSPIGDLTKTEVFALAAALGIAERIRRAKPSDGLFEDDRSDEDQLGASYPELEWAMALRGSGEPLAPSSLSSRQREVLAIYDRLHAANAHKWQPIPVCLIPEELRR